MNVLIWIIIGIVSFHAPVIDSGINPSALWILTQTGRVRFMMTNYVTCMTHAKSFPLSITTDSDVAYKLNIIRDSMDRLSHCGILTVVVCAPFFHLKATAKLADLLFTHPGIFGQVVGSPIKCGMRMFCIMKIKLMGCDRFETNDIVVPNEFLLPNGPVPHPIGPILPDGPGFPIGPSFPNGPGFPYGPSFSSMPACETNCQPGQTYLPGPLAPPGDIGPHGAQIPPGAISPHGQVFPHGSMYPPGPVFPSEPTRPLGQGCPHESIGLTVQEFQPASIGLPERGCSPGSIDPHGLGFSHEQKFPNGPSYSNGPIGSSGPSSSNGWGGIDFPLGYPDYAQGKSGVPVGAGASNEPANKDKF